MKVLIESLSSYLACPRFSKKVLDDNGGFWCSKCKTKVHMPIARESKKRSEENENRGRLGN
ncbi:hypothetical protein C5167_015946 [Papaver somniferum]|nr:hypothetical protein C5167_015946 [Papaver somniferum]